MLTDSFSISEGFRRQDWFARIRNRSDIKWKPARQNLLSSFYDSGDIPENCGGFIQQ